MPGGGSRVSAAVEFFGTRFSCPVLLASGTCGFGEPVVDVMATGAVGGLVTKSVTVEPRWGNPAPRVAEYAGGMLNSVGLANPGVQAVRASSTREPLPSFCGTAYPPPKKA
jgi:dihydroorotate dehydrogenase (NAD+) catalytic subunit